MTPDQQNDLLVRVDEKTTNMEKHLGDLCTLAKSESGFTRCGDRGARIRSLEREVRLIVGAILLGAIKLVWW